MSGFLKDPPFFTGSAFLKRPERVMALALLVYALAKGPPCAGCSGSSSGCAWWSWRAGPWSSTWPPITRPRCAYWGRGDITSWSEGVRNVGMRRRTKVLQAKDDGSDISLIPAFSNQ